MAEVVDQAPPDVDGLTDEEYEEQRQEILAETIEYLRKCDETLGRRSLADFVKQAFVRTYPDEVLEWGDNQEAICFHIQTLFEDRGRGVLDREYKLRTQNLAINVAPRSLKTFILVCATLWAWLHWPSLKIRYLSSNPRVALDSGRLVHEWITGSGPAKDWFVSTYHPTWRLRQDHAAPTDMMTTAGGARVAHGLDAQITGGGGDVLIIDDPHDLKDSVDRIIDACNKYSSSVHNRLNDAQRTSIRIMIMQRLDLEDLTGRMLLLKDWLHVRIPMHYRTKTSCTCGTCVGTNIYGWRDWRTVEGEVMHPRFTPEFLEAEKARLDMHRAGNEAQMEQEPISLTGGMVARADWNFFRLRGYNAGEWPRPPGCQGTNEGELVLPPLLVTGFGDIFISVDCANKNTAKGSRYGILACATEERQGERRFVLEDGSRRGSLSQIIQEVMVPMIKRWRPRRLLIEDKAAGPTMIDELTTMISDGKIKDEDGVSIHCAIEALGADAGGGDKVGRLSAQLRTIEARLVYLMEDAPWLAEFVKEFSMFNGSGMSDRIDALTQFLARTKVVKKSTLEVAW